MSLPKRRRRSVSAWLSCSSPQTHTPAVVGTYCGSSGRGRAWVATARSTLILLASS
jgi:hypothetical protein